MLKFLKKLYRYIYSAVFYAEVAAKQQKEFDAYVVRYAAWSIKEAIDRDILDSIYEEAHHKIEKAMMDNLILGKIPKIFVKPTAIETENHVAKVTMEWGVN